MKIDDLLTRLNNLGFSFGIIEFNKSRINFSASIPGRKTFVNIWIPQKTDIYSLYCLSLVIDDKKIIDENFIEYLDFKSHLKRLEVYIQKENEAL